MLWQGARELFSHSPALQGETTSWLQTWSTETLGHLDGISWAEPCANARCKEQCACLLLGKGLSAGHTPACKSSAVSPSLCQVCLKERVFCIVSATSASLMPPTLMLMTSFRHISLETPGRNLKTQMRTLSIKTKLKSIRGWADRALLSYSDPLWKRGLAHTENYKDPEEQKWWQVDRLCIGLTRNGPAISLSKQLFPCARANSFGNINPQGALTEQI